MKCFFCISCVNLKVPYLNPISLFLKEKSIFYAKIAVSQKIFFSKFGFKYNIGLIFS